MRTVNRIFWLGILLIFGAADASIRHPQSNKQFIGQLDEGQFEIVHPFQMRERNKERLSIDTHNYFLNASIHYKHVVIVIKTNVVLNEKIRLKLLLNLNEHLFYNSTQFEKLSKDGEEFFSYRIENCYYQGTVNGDSTSFVAISTCNGLRGIIAFENGTALGIWPLDGGDKGRKHPHVLYKTRWSRDASCGATTQTTPQYSPLVKMPSKRDVTRQMKYVELAIIGDHQFIKEFNLTEDEAVEYMLEAANIANAMLVPDLNVRLSVVYSEIWLDAQRIDLHSDIERTLSGAQEYVAGHIYQVDKDATILFTGGSFANNEMLTGAFASVCTSRAVGLIKVIDSYAVHNVAQFLAHTVGHILGIDHDSSDCTCAAQQLPCIMTKQAGAIGSAFTWQFSKCSVARLHNVLQSNHIQCLLNRPFQASQLHQCGNGIVDGDEECDCGRRDECNDPCCDPISCTLRTSAQCGSHHVCCNRCKLAEAGQVCRHARSVCDVAETCDGMSGDCPTDGYLVDGIACGISGNCWKGNCSDSEQQCKRLWGDEANAAEDPCYNHNEKGVEYGNCGRDRNGHFISCTPENKKCGILHCKDGRNLPRFSNLTSFNFQFLADGKQIQCKSITNVGVGLIEDGTSCGSGRVCLEGSCLPLTQVSPPVHCPSNNLALSCSGHGDCTTTQNCLCYDGWTGVACDIRSNNSRRLVFPSSDKSGVNLIIPSIRMNKSWDDTSALLGVLLLVGIFLLLLLICLLFCYRRRTSSSFRRPIAQEKSDDNFRDDSDRRAGSSIVKFGSTMPSWAKEKRNLKKNKHVYGALQRINEANEERDTLSVKSRESAALSSTNNLRHAASNGSAINAVLMERTRVEEMEAQHFVPRDRFYADTAAGIFADNTVSIHRRMSPMLSSPAHSDYTARRREALLIERNGRGSSSSHYEPDLLNDGPFPLYATGSMYNRTKVPPSMASPSGSTASRTTSNSRLNGPLKLSSFHAMLKQIESDQASNPGEGLATEDLKQFDAEYLLKFTPNGDNVQIDQAPASGSPGSGKDSGHVGSQCGDLFSDNFKLDVSSS